MVVSVFAFSDNPSSKPVHVCIIFLSIVALT